MSQESGKDKEHRSPSKLWVPFVVLIGAIFGFLSYIEVSSQFPFFPPFERRFEFEISQEFHIILSTIGIALLVALLVVYARTYRETRANFILGLLIVLFALLLQAILTSPLFFIFMTFTAFPPEFYSPLADVLTIIAYAVFLYLSLE